ncbi:hypothetical protein yc1106_09297 [Curvularia clavata]|uniref:Uncharacterized protein n=1 Tax=Curvularia clavata TaxID=95742 RepID=A0A9Q8ZL39_CURCL|nr:hypothetical protein yc1106_09297 [Curvularia clavata]
MVSKSSSPGPNATPATPTKQTRSRKGSTPNQVEQGRAGSAGGVVLPKKTVAKAPASSEKKASATIAANPATDDAATTGAKTPRKRPRKLNKEPTSTPTDKANSPTSSKIPNESLSNAELEALKARVRELEAKMEELYKTRGIVDSRAGRSPRRRGKGRKASSTEQVPQVKATESTADTTGPRIQEIVDNKEEEEEEADEELVRLEGELEVARQDLEHYRPRMRRTRSTETDYVEEIPRTPSRAAGGERQVTLSGSYRIPIPSSVNLEDVQTIKSGVSAAQNLARSFLEQRRAAAAAARAQSTAAAQDAQSSSSSRPSTTKVPPSKTRAKRNTNPNTEVAVDNTETKQSWGDWIGGYSLAISRAVSKIEHEAAVEAQMAGGSGSGGSRSARPQGNRRMSVPTSKKMAGKRPAAKPTLSAEQVHGLMS